MTQASAAPRTPPAPEDPWPRARLVRYLEDRFACTASCRAAATATARHCGTPAAEPAVLRALRCVEVCDNTARLLGAEPLHDPDDDELRFRIDWCRTACLDCAAHCANLPGAEEAVAACRACAASCTRFLTTLAAH
ncbi:ferredoxin [Streptomyces sp. CA-253872]|uniref:ferredoxin n=1 Tax=Streptomyces sp. CA-253872 TaxID=3240067 RepID=UPI003D913F3A